MKKILIAEDNVELSDIARNFLLKAGYTVFQAFDGQSALDMAKALSPDLVLLDIMMPKVDGFEVCQKLRSTMKIPVIVMSAKASEEDKVRMFDLEVSLNGQVVGTGSGSSKKRAEQMAARSAIAKLFPKQL